MNSEFTIEPYWKRRVVPSGLNVRPVSGPDTAAPVAGEVFVLMTPVGEIVDGRTSGRMLFAGSGNVGVGRPKFSVSDAHHARSMQVPTPVFFSYSAPTTMWPRPPRRSVPPATLAKVFCASPSSASPYEI